MWTEIINSFWFEMKCNLCQKHSMKHSSVKLEDLLIISLECARATSLVYHYAVLNRWDAKLNVILVVRLMNINNDLLKCMLYICQQFKFEYIYSLDYKQVVIFSCCIIFWGAQEDIPQWKYKNSLFHENGKLLYT